VLLNKEADRTIPHSPFEFLLLESLTNVKEKKCGELYLSNIIAFEKKASR